MLFRLRLPTVLSIVILLLTGCAGKQMHNHIDSSARGHIETVDAYLAVPQDEIYANIESSNITMYTGGGLIFALIDASINKSRTNNAEEIIQPLRDKLMDFDYAQILADEIGTRLKAVEWLNTSDLILERAITDDRYLQRMQSSSASAVLFMTADYSITTEFNAVNTRMALIMFPNVEALNKFKEKEDKDDNSVDNDDNIYRKDIIHTVSLPVTGTREENIKKLSKDNCSELKKALHQNAKEIAMKITRDINLDEMVDL